MKLHTSQSAGSALLISDDMGGAFDDDFLPRLCVKANGELITHCAGWHEEGGPFPEHRGHHVLQPVHGGVFAIYIVSHFGMFRFVNGS